MSDSLNLNSRYRKFINIFATVLLVVLILIFCLYLYSYFSLSKERNISNQVNKILENTIDERMFGPPKEEEDKDSDEKKKSELSKKLYEIYKENSSSVNGKRALWYSARFDFELGNFTNSLNKTLLLSTDKKFYLTPNVLYFQAIIYENLNQLEQSLKIIENFTKDYPDHHLNFSIRMMKAKLFLMMNNNDRAYQEYLELKKNSEYLNYTDLIEEKIQQVSLLNLIKNK